LGRSFSAEQLKPQPLSTEVCGCRGLFLQSQTRVARCAERRVSEGVVVSSERLAWIVQLFQVDENTMSNADQESWSRVKERLRAEVGDDVYSSWFARMDLEAIEEGGVRLSVPTRFLKSWIQSHYAERVLACWQAHDTNISRIELIVRSAVLRNAVAQKPRTDDAPTPAWI
jgi:hypothetical protein